MNIPIDSSTDIAHFRWQCKGFMFDKNSRQKNNVNHDVKRAQILSPDHGLYMIPPATQSSSVCLYLDFASIKTMPQELSFQTAQRLTEALKLINPKITDIRISKIENGLSVILDGKQEATLGTMGNGAVTWASTLYAIFELVERYKVNKDTNIPIFVLIDEIGTGIHYSVMSDVWRYIRDFSILYPNIQFVATSHSDDCIRAFCETFITDDKTANVVRLSKTFDNEIISTKYDTSQFETIMTGEWEVRG
jgi:hypothetical protein